MKALVEYIVKSLVDHPEQVTVKEVEGERMTVVEIRVDPTDAGKVIGKEGRTIKSLRTLASCAAAKTNKRIMVELLE